MISREDCNQIISWFDDYPDKMEGVTYVGDGSNRRVVNYDQKKDIEVPGCYLSDGSLPSSILVPALQKTLSKYHLKYLTSLERIATWGLEDDYNLQKYSNSEDGFHSWHCESGSSDTSHRILAWMVYLNHAKCGTQFTNFKTVKPRQGRIVIWPASWTHVHKSVTPNKGLKYIATGWVSYQN